MVSRVITLWLSSVILAAAGLDLTPTPHRVEIEGVKVMQVGFHDGGRTVIYDPPGGWSLAGGGARLTLTPKEGSFAEGAIEVHPLPQSGALDEEVLSKLKAEMTATLPKEARSVEWGEVEVNPVLLNQKETRRLTVSYTAFAQRFVSTVIVCNLRREQLRFRFSARENNFERLYDVFRRSLFTLQGLE